MRSILAQCDIYYYGWNWTVFADFYDELLDVDVVFMRISWYMTQRYANIWSIILWMWYHGKVRIMNILVRRNRTSATRKSPILWLMTYSFLLGYWSRPCRICGAWQSLPISQQKLWFGMHKNGSKKWFLYHRTADVKPFGIFA